MNPPTFSAATAPASVGSSTRLVQVLKQHLSLHVDLDDGGGRIEGVSTIFMRRAFISHSFSRTTAMAIPLRTVALHSRQCSIKSVRLIYIPDENENLSSSSTNNSSSSSSAGVSQQDENGGGVSSLSSKAVEVEIKEFTCEDYLFRLSDDNNIRDLRTISASLAGSVEASELLGELQIEIPEEVAQKLHEKFLKRIRRDAAVAAERRRKKAEIERRKQEEMERYNSDMYFEEQQQEEISESNKPPLDQEDEPEEPNVDDATLQQHNDVFALRIEYDLVNPVGLGGGAIFVPPASDGTPGFMYTNACFAGSGAVGGGCGARCWFPCLDLLDSRCPFEAVITCDSGLRAIASGTLDHVVVSKDQPSLTSFHFSHAHPIAPHNFALVVGPFEEVQADENNKNPWFHHYCLPGRNDMVTLAIEDINVRVGQIEDCLGVRYPFGTYSQVWISAESAYNVACSYSTMAIISDGLLANKRNRFCISSHPATAASEDNFDSAMNMSSAQAICFAASFFGSLITVNSYSDAWLTLGLSGYVDLVSNKGHKQKYHDKLLLFFRRCKRTQRRMNAVAIQRSQAGNVMGRHLSPYRLPLWIVDSALWAAKGLDLGSVVAQRATVCIHQLEQRSGSTDEFMRLIREYLTNALRSVSKLPKPTEESTVNQDWQHQILQVLRNLERRRDPPIILNTNDFLRDHRAKMEVDLAQQMESDSFEENWLRQTTVPHFVGNAQYIKRHHRVETSFDQMLQNLELDDGSGYTRGSSFGTRPFSGMIKIRVVEDDGPWDYEKTISAPPHRWTIKCHAAISKAKSGRKTNEALQRQQEWLHPEDLSMSELLVSTRMSIKKRVRDVELPVRYVIPDPGFALLAEVEWDMPDSMWLDMLSDADKTGTNEMRPFAFRNMARGLVWHKDASIAASRDEEDTLGIYAAGATAPVANANMKVGLIPVDYDSIRASSLRSLSVFGTYMTNPQIHVRIRVEATLVMAEWQSYRRPKRANHLGLDKDGHSETWAGALMLVRCFRELFYSRSGNSTNDDDLILNKDSSCFLLPNDFSIGGEGYLKPAAMIALSRMNAQDGQYPRVARDLLLDLLRNNDNAGNEFDDGHYKSEMAKAAGHLCVGLYLTSKDPTEPKEVVEEAEQYLNEVIGHIRRMLDFDIISPSPGHIVTVGCLEAFALLESKGITSGHHQKVAFHSYVVGKSSASSLGGKNEMMMLDVSKKDWESPVREVAFRAIVHVYVIARAVQGAAWMNIVDWLIRAAASDPCYSTRRAMFNYLLATHADTVDMKIPELRNNSSPSGAFWPLMNPPSDMGPDERHGAIIVANTLWQFMNESAAYDSRTRILVHQLWRAIWGYDTPLIFENLFALEGSSLVKPFDRWDIDSEHFRELVVSVLARDAAILAASSAQSQEPRDLSDDGDVNDKKRPREGEAPIRIKLPLPPKQSTPTISL